MIGPVASAFWLGVVIGLVVGPALILTGMVVFEADRARRRQRELDAIETRFAARPNPSNPRN